MSEIVQCGIGRRREHSKSLGAGSSHVLHISFVGPVIFEHEFVSPLQVFERLQPLAAKLWSLATIWPGILYWLDGGKCYELFWASAAEF
jgi:hypothetical protein